MEYVGLTDRESAQWGRDRRRIWQDRQIYRRMCLY